MHHLTGWLGLPGGSTRNAGGPSGHKKRVMVWSLAIVLAVVADKASLLHATPEKLFTPILLLALAALGIGLTKRL